ncbi:hypothetical protein F5Y17DRAFT_227587 [Xylariaceae sp. FL0594]|nr:hypothetical protein F5Y17DRAFT_227587 [Xylariaceae sp. FL0594]
MQFATFALAALSLGSAIAAPAPAPAPALPVVGGLPGLEVALGAVSHVKDIVEQQVAAVEAILKIQDTAEVVGKVQEILITVGQNVNGLLTPIQALPTTASSSLKKKQQTTPLSADELEQIPGFVGDFQAIFVGVQTISKTVVGGISQDAIQEVKPELQFVLASVVPVTRPLISFVTAVVPGSSAIVQQVSPVIAQLQTGLDALLAPLDTLLGVGLGGLL